MVTEALEGLQAVRKKRWVTAMLITDASHVLLAVAPWLVVLPVLAVDHLGGTSAYGTVLAGFAAGGIAGGLIGLGIPEYEAKRYEGQVKEGGILLSVHCDDSEWCDKAEDILERCGATDISSTSEADADANESKRPFSMSGDTSRT